MKPKIMKKMILAAAVASAVTLSYSVLAENGLDKTAENSIENHSTPRDGNITNPNVKGYTASEAPIVESADIDHEGVVHFEPNSVSLTQQAESQLKQLVEQLDKDKPVSLTVDMQGYDTALSEQTGTQRPQSVQGNKDSSAGYPAAGEGMAGRSASDRRSADPELENRAELIANYRVETIRLYLLEKGVEVVEWNLEGQPSSFSGTASEDTGIPGRATAGPTDPQTGRLQNLEDVQQVRIVVVGEIRLDGLSAL